MAVVQISRIQIRRGQKNQGTGLPQLASGELAWAIDTQELYIGNGAVSEGAPNVGNTKILTVADNILDIAGEYTYKNGSATIQTGSDINYPIQVSLQERLDERVTCQSFGILSDGLDQSSNIQRAIDMLYINNVTSGVASRVDLEFLPGIYNFNTTIFLPSYVSIKGAGRQKTIFNFQGEGTAFRFINDTSTMTSRSAINTTTYNNQPKFCRLEGFTLNLNEPDVEGIRLDAVRDSVFTDVEIVGTFGDSAGDSTVSGGGHGFSLNALSSLVTCQRNRFVSCRMERLEFGIYAKQDITNNTIYDCEFIDSRHGIDFGTGANLTSTGEQYGPRRNNIINCYFDDIERYGIRISNGYYNKSRGNTFINVGNDGGNYQNNVYSPIVFATTGNSSTQDNFDRQLDLAVYDPVYPTKFTEDYINEVQGKMNVNYFEPIQFTLVQSYPNLSNAMRFPYNGESRIVIDYMIKSSVYIQVRTGKISIAVDDTNSSLQLTDDYEYTGTVNEDSKITFSAILLNNCVVIQYRNQNIGDSSTMTYTYSVLS